MSLIWRQIGDVNSLPNQQHKNGRAQFNTRNNNGPTHDPTGNRIKVVRPQTFLTNPRASHYGNSPPPPQREHESSNSPNDVGFWMTPHAYHSGSRSSPPSHDNYSYIEYDDGKRHRKEYHQHDDDVRQQPQPKQATDNNDEPDQKKYKNVFEEFCQETGFDGLKHAGNSALSTFVRLIWVVIVLGAATGLMYQVVKSTLKYSSYGVNTKFSSTEYPIVDFPTITVCNINLFRSDRLSKLYGGYDPLLEIGLLQLRQLFPQVGVAYEPKDVPLDNYYPGNVDLGEFITLNSHKLEDMLVKCTFNGEPCNADNFTAIVTNYGVCYSYNSDPLTVQSVNQAGQRRGLSLILNAQHKLYVAAPRESAGFKVLAHDVNEFPNMDDHGKELQTGTHVAFGLELTKSTKLGHPYGDCVAEDGYTQDKCLIDCQTDYIGTHCNCRTYYMTGVAPYCSPIQLVDCVYGKIDFFNINRHEICECVSACKQKVFRASLSQSTYPSYAVPLVLAANEKWHFMALGFGEIVTQTAFPLFIMELDDERNSVYDAIAGLTNSEGVTFLEFTSLDVVAIFHNATTEAIFRNVPYDIYDSMGDKLFYDIVYDYGLIQRDFYQHIGPDSEYYWKQVELSFENYVDTDVLWNILHESLSAGGGPLDDATVLQVYEQFGFEDFFYDAFNVTFNGVYSLMKEVAERDVIPTLDLQGVATQYMRSNLVHVDIFYEDLKVTEIEDQAGYEFFQFICDIGGALGLFFGASLLSFIEVFAFCSTRNR